jgi:outer membrane protein assembly factor BamB
VGYFYFGSAKGLYGLDAKTGQQRFWFETSHIVTSAPLASGDLIYFGGWDGTVYAVQP